MRQIVSDGYLSPVLLMALHCSAVAEQWGRSWAQEGYGIGDIGEGAIESVGGECDEFRAACERYDLPEPDWYTYWAVREGTHGTQDRRLTEVARGHGRLRLRLEGGRLVR